MSTLDTPTRSVPDLDPALAQRLIARIADDAGTDEDYARRILDQTLTFIDYAGRVGQMCSPSPDVDEGWHAFILYTVEYTRHTTSHYGRYVQHMPDDDPERPTDGPNFVETAHNMAHAGYDVDWDLWLTMLAPRTDPRGVTTAGRTRAHLRVASCDTKCGCPDGADTADEIMAQLGIGCYPGILRNNCHVNSCNDPDCFSTNTDEDDDLIHATIR